MRKDPSSVNGKQYAERERDEQRDREPAAGRRCSTQPSRNLALLESLEPEQWAH
jgi:hypothetical protein